MTVVVNGSATPNVIGALSPESGALAISSSRLFCQKQTAKAIAKAEIETTIRVRSSPRCSTRVSRSSKATRRKRAIDSALSSVTTSPSTTSGGLVELSASAGISSLSSMERDPLNSRIPFPIDLPSSGRRLGPKTIRAITRTMAISSGPIFGIGNRSFRLLSTACEPPGGGSPRLAFSLDLCPPSGSVCGLCQLLEDVKELRWLSDEQSVGGQGLDRAHGRVAGLGGADDRDGRELALQEGRRLRHDQVGLGELAVGIQVREHQLAVGQRRRVPGFVVPGLEMHDLAATDAEQDAQHLPVGDALCQRGVEAGATLLDERKVEAGRIGDRLEVVGIGEVSVGAGDRRMLADR